MPELCPMHNTPLHRQAPYRLPGGARTMRCLTHHHDWLLPPAPPLPPLCPIHGTPLTDPQWVNYFGCNLYQCAAYDHTWAISPDHEEAPVPAPAPVNVTEEQRARAIQLCLTLHDRGYSPDDRGLPPDEMLTRFMERADRLAAWCATGQDQPTAPRERDRLVELAGTFIALTHPRATLIRRSHLAGLLADLMATGAVPPPQDRRWQEV